jgi:hypothetical protein
MDFPESAAPRPIPSLAVVTRPQTSPNENTSRKNDQGFSAGRMLTPAPNRRLTSSLGTKPGLVIK